MEFSKTKSVARLTRLMISEMEMKTRVPTPMFKGAETYEQYKIEVKLWQIVCGLDKNKQVIVLWLNLPQNDASDIKVKIFNEIEAEMNTDDGVKRYLEVMDAAFKLSEQATIYKVFLNFLINMKKKPDEMMMEFVT